MFATAITLGNSPCDPRLNPQERKTGYLVQDAHVPRCSSRRHTHMAVAIRLRFQKHHLCDDQYRSAEILASISRGSPRSAHHTLPERPSPLAALQRPPGSSPMQIHGRLLHIVENTIHRLRYTIRRVARHVFAECTRIHLAPRPFRRCARVSARSKMSSGMETAVFIPAV